MPETQRLPSDWTFPNWFMPRSGDGRDQAHRPRADRQRSSSRATRRETIPAEAPGHRLLVSGLAIFSQALVTRATGLCKSESARRRRCAVDWFRLDRARRSRPSGPAGTGAQLVVLRAIPTIIGFSHGRLPFGCSPQADVLDLERRGLDRGEGPAVGPATTDRSSRASGAGRTSATYRAAHLTAAVSACGARARANTSSTSSASASESLGSSAAAATTMLGLPVFTALANRETAWPWDVIGWTRVRSVASGHSDA